MYGNEPIRRSSAEFAQYGALITFALVKLALSLHLFEPMAVYLNPVVVFYLFCAVSIACAASFGFGYIRYIRSMRCR